MILDFWKIRDLLMFARLLVFLCHKVLETIEEDLLEDLWGSFIWFLGESKFESDREGDVKNEPFSPKWGVTSFLMYHMQDWHSQHFLEIGFYMSIFWLIDWRDGDPLPCKVYFSVWDARSAPQSIACFCLGLWLTKKKGCVQTDRDDIVMFPGPPLL